MLKGMPAMAAATSSPPAPMASIPMPPPVGVWLSEPSRVLPGAAEPLQMHLVADAVAGPGEEDAVFGGHILEKAVVVGIFKSGLQRVVVHIAHGELCLDTVKPDGLELQIGHGARGVLGQGLVDPQCIFGIGGLDEVASSMIFAVRVFGHGSSPPKVFPNP